MRVLFKAASGSVSATIETIIDNQLLNIIFATLLVLNRKTSGKRLKGNTV